MGKCEKLLAKARRAPNGLRFSELCQLAECFEFELARMRGSHRVYKRSGLRAVLNFQPRGKAAKHEQVKDLLKLIDAIERTRG